MKIQDIMRRIAALEPGQKVEINESLLTMATPQELAEIKRLCAEKGAEVDRSGISDTLVIWVK